MNLISYLPKERDWGPLSTGLRHLEQWRRILKYSEGYLLLAEYVKVLLGRTVVELGWNNNGKDEIKYTEIFRIFFIFIYNIFNYLRNIFRF